MSNKVNVEGALLLEQPFAKVSPSSMIITYGLLCPDMHWKVPYEAYRKIFRTSQKYVERELGSVQATAKDLSKLNDATYNPEEALKSIEMMMKKVEGLKRKVRFAA